MGSLVRKTATAVIAVVAAVTLAGCGGASDRRDGGGTEAASPEAPVITGEPAGYNAADITFANTVIPHHKQAIALSALVPDRSADPELTALASRIAATAQPEINILNVFLVQWNQTPQMGIAAESGLEPTMPGKVDDATMARLKSLRGPEFDRLWLQSMIGHHQGAVVIARSEIANGDNVDAVAMAKTLVATQEAEIGQMKKMLEGNP